MDSEDAEIRNKYQDSSLSWYVSNLLELHALIVPGQRTSTSEMRFNDR